jgi:hypothetical protein
VTEILIKTESQDWERFKTLSRELFHGDDTTTFREAVLALISLRQKQDTSRLRAIIDKIRSDIESAGGLTARQIDQLVRESRQRRRAMVK